MPRRTRINPELKHIAVALALFGAMGCGKETAPDPLSCFSQADCRAGFACIDNMCAEQTRDAGQRDAGPGPFTLGDAGKPDAGRRDAGNDAGPGGGDGGPTCIPTTCELAGAQCGEIADGCGGEHVCSCPPTMSCVDNECQPVCQPRTCQNAGIECGMTSDGCGGMLHCGCTSGLECRNGRCETPCTPRTCSQAGAQCGQIDNGCNGMRNCGGCDRGSCQNNQCVCSTRSFSTGFKPFGRAQNNSVGTANAGWQNVAGAQQKTDASWAHVRFSAPRGPQMDCTRTQNNISTLLRFLDANINVPSDAVITGVQVRIRGRTLGANPVMRGMHLWGVGQVRSDERNRGNSFLRASFSSTTFGGSNDTWSLSQSQLTPAFVNNFNFGFRIGLDRYFVKWRECGGSDSEPQIAWAEVNVHYTACR